MSYYDIVVKEILLLIMAIAILRTVGREQNDLQSRASSILIAALVVVFMVWIVDTVLWLEVEILQSPLVQRYSLPSPQIFTPAIERIQHLM
jgi:membrane protein YdbS with pleckstrin-like domain